MAGPGNIASDSADVAPEVPFGTGDSHGSQTVRWRRTRNPIGHRTQRFRQENLSSVEGAGPAGHIISSGGHRSCRPGDWIFHRPKWMVVDVIKRAGPVNRKPVRALAGAGFASLQVSAAQLQGL